MLKLGALFRGSLASFPQCLFDEIRFSPSTRHQPESIIATRPQSVGHDVRFYSCLSAAIGSIWLALRAGIQQASVATPNRIAGTPMKTGRLTSPFVIA